MIIQLKSTDAMVFFLISRYNRIKIIHEVNNMKQRKKRPTPPPPPMAESDFEKKDTELEDAPPVFPSSFIDSDDPEYQKRHALAQALQLRTAQEGYVLLKNTGILPFPESELKLNVFGRHADLFFDPELCLSMGIKVNKPLYDAYTGYRCRDAAYTGSGYDEETEEYLPQSRTSTGMFGGFGYIDPEPFIGHQVTDSDGSVRISPLSPDLLEEAKAFSDAAAVVIYRHGGEGADHEKGDERLTEGESAMLSFCTEHFSRVVVILACNSVIDGDFLAEDSIQKFYQYTYGGGVYSNNVGHEVLSDFDSRVSIRYTAPHCYPIHADKLGGVIYTCNKPGDLGAQALLRLLLGLENPSGRLTDEILYDYDDDPVSRCSGGLAFSRQSTTEDLYIYGHNYVAYKEGVYLGYRYFETFCPDRVVYPFGYGLSYTSFHWDVGALEALDNQFGELSFRLNVTVTNTGSVPGREVVELYTRAPYYESSKYHLEKPLVVLSAYEKTVLLAPGCSQTLTLLWNARDIANYSDTAECYVLEAGSYIFAAASNANAAHTAPVTELCWNCPEDILFVHDEVTGTAYRNLFTGNDRDGWRFDARGTEQEHIVYIHRTDVDGAPTVAPGTYPEYPVIDERTRETTQILDLETRGLSSYYELDGTDVHLYTDDIPVPRSNAVYRDASGNQKNFMLQDVNRLVKDSTSPDYHNPDSLKKLTGIAAETWTSDTDQAVWDHFIAQFSVNEMLLRFYHSGFDIPAIPEYGVPQLYSADTPGQIGSNNPVKMFQTTGYCDTILACTFDKDLCYKFGLALGREAAASGEKGTSFFYAPGNNLHRSCLSGKNNNYFSQDAYLAGRSCGYFLKGLEEGGVNGCMKHFACNDQEISREGLVVFSNEQALRELYLGAFEEALKIGGGMGIMTSLGRVGTVNACGNDHLCNQLLRKEWGFDGMLITDGYGVTSYMYEINDMIGASSGLLCFGHSGNFGECRDYMELYRYYLQYPGRTTAALQKFMQGCMKAALQSHTFRDLYTDFDYRSSPDAPFTTDINWYDAQIGLGYRYHQGESLQYLGIKLQPGESNPPSMMPNDNCKDRSGTIATDDYGISALSLSVSRGNSIDIPVSIEKCAGLQDFALEIHFDRNALELEQVSMAGSILSPDDYSYQTESLDSGLRISFRCIGDVFSIPCGLLFTLTFHAAENAKPGPYALTLLPAMSRDSVFLYDKQGHEVSISLQSQREKYSQSGGWSGTYQNVDSGEWWAQMEIRDTDELADLTLLSNQVEITP